MQLYNIILFYHTRLIVISPPSLRPVRIILPRLPPQSCLPCYRHTLLRFVSTNIATCILIIVTVNMANLLPKYLTHPPPPRLHQLKLFQCSFAGRILLRWCYRLSPPVQDFIVRDLFHFISGEEVVCAVVVWYNPIMTQFCFEQMLFFVDESFGPHRNCIVRDLRRVGW